MLTAEYGPLHVGGLGSFLTALCSAIDPERFTPVVALPRSGYSVPWAKVAEHTTEWCRADVYLDGGVEVWLLANDVLDRAPIFPLPAQHALIKKFDDFGERVAELLDAMRVDLVHLHDSFGYKCLHEARARALPTVFTVHRLHRDVPHLFLSEVVAAKLVDTVTSVGRAYAEDNADFFGPTAPPVIHNGIDPGFWRYPEAELLTAGRAERRRQFAARLGLPDRPTFAYVGRLDADQKGIDVLLRAVSGRAPREHNLVIAGEGSAALGRALGALAAEARDRVAFLHRRVEAHEVREIFSAVDFAIIPSRYEPFGIIQLEAMAMGAVPLASATGGLKEVIVDVEHAGGFGRLVPAGDPVALATAIAQLTAARADEPGRVDALRRRGAEVARAYTHRAMARGYEALYTAALAKRGAA
jgi:glycogen synthase